MTTIRDSVDMIKTFLFSGLFLYDIAEKMADDIEMTPELKRIFSQGEYAIGEERKNEIMVINFITTALAICICHVSIEMTEEGAKENLKTANRSILAHLELFTDFLKRNPNASAPDYFAMMASAEEEKDEK